MKNLILIFTLLFSIAASAHNPLAGTKWKMVDAKGNITYLIDFSAQSQGSITAGDNVCDFNYRASHTDLYIKIAECNDSQADAGIIACCEQNTIPFTQKYATAEAPAKLVLKINEKEYELVKAE